MPSVGSVAVAPGLPSAPMGPPPDASAPVSPAAGFVGSCVRGAAGALRARPALMAGSVLVIAAANAPQQLAQWAASAGLERMQASAEARGSAAPTPEEAIADLATAASSCGWLCGSLVFTLLVGVPAIAGAALAAARATAGDGRAGDLAAGFRGRWVPTALAGFVTVLVGGGAAVLAAILGSVAVLGPASRVASGLVPAPVLTALLWAVIALTLWLTVRLWFAVVRAADPRRPRIGGIAAVVSSWTWTEGSAQWHVAGVGLVAFAAVLALLMPGHALWQPDGNGAAPGVGIALMVVGGAVGCAAGLALMGAAYERLADANEPVVTPPVSGGAA